MIKSKHHGVINNNEKINNAFKVNGFKVINYVYANDCTIYYVLKDYSEKFNIDFNGLKIMDIGSSTGGFCDCALKHGVKPIVPGIQAIGNKIVLYKKSKNNPKIELHEKTNFKDFDSKYFKDIDAIVCDVSFVSLKKISIRYI